jgi:hypothetical protein
MSDDDKLAGQAYWNRFSSNISDFSDSPVVYTLLYDIAAKYRAENPIVLQNVLEVLNESGPSLELDTITAFVHGESSSSMPHLSDGTRKDVLPVYIQMRRAFHDVLRSFPSGRFSRESLQGGIEERISTLEGLLITDGPDSTGSSAENVR